MRYVSLLVLTGVLALASLSEALGQVPYDGIQAGIDAYRRQQSRLVIQSRAHVTAMEAMKFKAITGVLPGDPWGYGAFPSLFDPWPGNRELLAPQPLGHRSIQTGPDRWEYHPVYSDDLAEDVADLVPPRNPFPAPHAAPIPRKVPPPLPVPAAPAVPLTPEVIPPDRPVLAPSAPEEIFPKPRVQGPREF